MTLPFPVLYCNTKHDKEQIPNTSKNQRKLWQEIVSSLLEQKEVAEELVPLPIDYFLE